MLKDKVKDILYDKRLDSYFNIMFYQLVDRTIFKKTEKDIFKMNNYCENIYYYNNEDAYLTILFMLIKSVFIKNTTVKKNNYKTILY